MLRIVALRTRPRLVRAFAQAAASKTRGMQSEEVHFRAKAESGPKLPSDRSWNNPIPHGVWSKEEVESVEQVHVPPETIRDKVALRLAKATRVTFDWVTGYKHEGRLSPEVWLRRLIFLETIAGVPGMVAGMLRHMRSLRRLRRDHGWIHTLLAEAENERMHLLTLLRLRDPGPMFRLTVLAAQGVFFNVFFLSYLVSPHACHRFVGYIEEEAVKTYTRLANDLQTGNLPEWEKLEVPDIARAYWHLKPDAAFVDLILAIRRDEAHHRDVNHTFASLHVDDVNPYIVKPPAGKKEGDKNNDRRALRGRMLAERLVWVLSLLLTVILCGTLLHPSTSPFHGTASFYVWHPVLMVLGFLLVTSQGFLAYVGDFGAKLNRVLATRSERRMLHGTIQLFGTVLCLAGYLVVLAVNSSIGQSNIGTHVSSARVAAHIYLGYLTLFGMVVQCASGIRKFIIRERDELNVAKWHTLFGTLVYLMGATTAVLGVEYGYLELESSRPWGILIMVLVSLLSVTIVFTTLRGPSPSMIVPKVAPQFTYLEPRV